MEILCDGMDLSEAVITVLKATSTKTTNPILEGIKLKAFNDILELSGIFNVPIQNPIAANKAVIIIPTVDKPNILKTK